MPANAGATLCGASDVHAVVTAAGISAARIAGPAGTTGALALPGHPAISIDELRTAHEGTLPALMSDA